MTAAKAPSTLRSRPTVLFADDHGWMSFDQVAAALRHRGIRTVRVMTREPARLRDLLREPHLRWLADRAFYDETVVLCRPGGPERLASLLDRGVDDVIATEPTLEAIGLESELGRRMTGQALAFRGAPAEVLLDKFEVNERLAAHGVGVPLQVRADLLTPAQAVRRFGLPLVIKGGMGAGGDQVRIAGSLAEVKEALEALGGDRAEIFYQEHVRGPMVFYTGVHGPDGPLLEQGFAVGSSQYELGPSASVRIYDRPELIAAGRRAAQLFGCQGYAEFDFMEAPDGRLLHVDANTRVWGFVLAPLSVGIDFVEAYAALLRGRAKAGKPVETADAGELPVFPFTLLQAVRAGSATEILAAAREFLGAYAAKVGLRYCLVTCLQAALVGAGRLRRMLRSRVGQRRLVSAPDAAAA
jgi:hypothetical protein